MASRDFSYGSTEIDVDKVLGVGSYGKVCKAKCGQLPCAAKLLHDTLFQDNDPGTNTLASRFEQECQFLSNIKHPNIVQYLGTMRDPKSRRPVLLMELMDESLTRFLERSTLGLPYHSQLNICHDVALALAYLHSNTIIHRDLSSNNVLLIGEGIRAKVTDFGMSKLTEMNPRMTPLTQCPGTSVYMPPEALITPPHYSSKLDIFSHGVLTIQIITRNFPNPGDASKFVKDSKYPTGRVLVHFPEADRRRKDIDLIEADHPLLPTTLHCIKDIDTERPSADELCEGLASLKSSARYRDSVEQTREQTSSVQRLQLELEAKEQELQREREEKERLTAELRDSQAREQSSPPVAIQQEDNGHKLLDEVSLKLTWRQGKQAPVKGSLNRISGSAVVHGNTAYFPKGCSVYSYTLPEDKWTELQQCQYAFFSLAVVNDKLTTIGGKGWIYDTNSLLSLTSGQWKELLPPMPTPRRLPATVTTTTHLVVAGGVRYDYYLSIVEVMDTDTLQWSTASSLPVIIQRPCMTLCGGYLYISSSWRNTVFPCSVEGLLQSCQPPSDKSTSTNSSSKGGSVWTRLADKPVDHGRHTLATLEGHVLAIGGTTIHLYDKATNSWNAVTGEMPIPHVTGMMLTPFPSAPLAAVLPSNELIVVNQYGNVGIARLAYICVRSLH